MGMTYAWLIQSLISTIGFVYEDKRYAVAQTHIPTDTADL